MKFNEWVPQKNQAGWITGDGDIINSKFLEHLDVLVGTALDKEYHNYLDRCEANEEEMNNDLENLDPDEHPAMHRFAFMNDDARDDLYHAAYSAGWVRFGVSNIYKGSCTLEVHGSTNRLNEMRKDITKLVADLGWKARLCFVEKNTKNLWREPAFKFRWETIERGM